MYIAAKKFPLDSDLRGFSYYLWQQKIAHRISEQQQQLVVWVEHDELVERVERAYQEFLTLPPIQFKSVPIFPGLNLSGFFGAFWHTPITLILIVLALILFVLCLPSEEFAFSIQRFLYFQPLFEQGAFIGKEPLSPWQLWRFVTPIFIHFGIGHLAFNCMWIWLLGQRLETANHRAQFIFISLNIAILSNTAQWLIGQTPLFGGFSGLVYGYLGLYLIWQQRFAGQLVALPKGLYIFMLIWLRLGYTELSVWLGLGKIANTAHLSGLLCGLACGFIYRPRQTT